MKKSVLLIVSIILGISINAFSQGGKLEIPIVQTNEVISDSIWVEDPETEEDTLWGVVTVPLSSDDAEEITITMEDKTEIDDLNDDDLDFGWEGEADDLNIVNIGLRFQNIQLPKGETIDGAWIEMTSHEEKTAEDVAKITIYGEASDDAQTFTEEALISDRPFTSASIKWTIDEEWELWGTYKSPDLKNIVQEIIDREGWQSGNSLAFIFKGENQGVSELEHAREIESFENIADPEEGGDGANHPERVPKLIIHYGGYQTAVSQVSSNRFKVYPNPAENGMVNISLQNHSFAEVSLYNITGKMVKSLNTMARQLILDVSDLPKGVYIMKAVQENNTYTKKIMIK